MAVEFDAGEPRRVHAHQLRARDQIFVGQA
jgi:hypothetical protein